MELVIGLVLSLIFLNGFIKENKKISKKYWHNIGYMV